MSCSEHKGREKVTGNILERMIRGTGGRARGRIRRKRRNGVIGIRRGLVDEEANGVVNEIRIESGSAKGKEQSMRTKHKAGKDMGTIGRNGKGTSQGMG